LAGIISLDAAGGVHAPNDMAAPIYGIYDIMEATLAKNGASLEHVVNEVMYTTDMTKLFEAVAVRAKRYEGFANPATTAVQIIALAFRGALLEIQVTAQLDGGEWSPRIPPVGSRV
jgi:enamine deaminase RidA (YjgF/YER057c/UK114 family)